MSGYPTIENRNRARHPVPANFLEVRNLLWANPDGERVDPIAFFELRANKLGLNLRNMAEVIITCREERFGVEYLYKDGLYEPNMLVMGALSVAATLEAWHEAQSAE